MLTRRVVTATEARTNLFDLLKKAENGDEVIIVKRDSNKRYKIVAIAEKPKKNIAAILDEMGKIGFNAPSIKRMKEIFETRYE